jgi:hypothetical protein
MTPLHRALAAIAVATVPALLSFACEGVKGADTGPDADTDTDTDTDTGSDTDTGTGTDTGTETDSETDTETSGDGGVIEMDCSACPAVGGTLDNMLCAIDMCDADLVMQNEYASLLPMSGCTLEDTYEAVERFGATTNDLAPKKNDSYALMASGIATGTAHSGGCTEYSVGGAPDPWSSEGYPTFDPFEWRLVFVAPPEAKGFRFKYVFFSEEYDDFIGTTVNDKFYVVLEAASTDGGAAKVINFTSCRDPDAYYDFICAAGDSGCEEGEKYCYVAINSALSDCCWYNGCPGGFSSEVGTNISGTGFECGSPVGTDGSTYGSSTGWLQTSWPIDGGEMFSLTFHIHDTSDQVWDSEVILDAFEFTKDAGSGTVPIE